MPIQASEVLSIENALKCEFPTVFDEKLVVPNTKFLKELLFDLQTTGKSGVFQKPFRTNSPQERDALRDTLAILVAEKLLRPAFPDC